MRWALGTAPLGMPVAVPNGGVPAPATPAAASAAASLLPPPWTAVARQRRNARCGSSLRWLRPQTSDAHRSKPASALALPTLFQHSVRLVVDVGALRVRVRHEGRDMLNMSTAVLSSRAASPLASVAKLGVRVVAHVCNATMVACANRVLGGTGGRVDSGDCALKVSAVGVASELLLGGLGVLGRVEGDARRIVAPAVPAAAMVSLWRTLVAPAPWAIPSHLAHTTKRSSLY